MKLPFLRGGERRKTEFIASIEEQDDTLTGLLRTASAQDIAEANRLNAPYVDDHRLLKIGSHRKKLS